MNRADDKTVQLGIIGYQSNTFAIPLRDEERVEHHSVGASQGALIPDAIYLAISALAGSWNLSGIGRGADTRYGTL